VPEDFEDRFPESREITGNRLEVSRREFEMRTRILDALEAGPLTVPEVANALGMPAHEVMWWVMGYVKYGYVAATEEVTEDGYYKYRRTEEKE
jgi:predicted Rossmann fold nucleotide-binding protein DprA/Smf involved in DNA uptake